jgi:hypothetical protein
MASTAVPAPIISATIVSAAVISAAVVSTAEVSVAVARHLEIARVVDGEVARVLCGDVAPGVHQGAVPIDVTA